MTLDLVQIISLLNNLDILADLDIPKVIDPSGKVLKEVAVSIGEHITHIFNLCISNGIFPDIWKL